MTKQVLIFLHMDDEHPGYIGHYLKRNNIPYRIVRGYQGDPIPTLDESMAGLVFMGGIMSANDDIPWIKQEIELIREALDNNVPLLGHCLGGQLITVALGYEVTANPVEEVGWHTCHKQPGRHTEDWLGDLDDTFIMFHWHLETFALPAEAQLLFSSEHCHNQAYCYGDNVLAMQGHVEMTEPMLVEWITQWKSVLIDQSPSVQNYLQINEQLKANITALNEVAEQLYQRWASTLAL
jgi:GMP synthase-like glutamine amidotransferase